MELKDGYINSEIGIIPEKWVVKNLGDIGLFSKGRGIKKDEALSGTIPCVRYGEIYTTHHDYIKKFHSFISGEVANTSKKISKGDILFAGSGETKEEIGKCVAFIDNFDAYAGGDIVILTPKNCDSLFLGFLLNSETVQKQKSSKGQGDAVVHIHAHHLDKISIPLPPLPEQQAIAEVLSDTDSLIQALEKQIAKKRQIKQGAMQQLLTPKEGWEEKKLGKIANFYNGKAHEQFIDEHGKYKVVNSKFISTNGTVMKFANQNLCPLKEGDITMVMSDIPNGKALAKCFIIPENDNYALNQRICTLRGENINNKFLAAILNRNKYYLAFDSGTGQTNLKKDDVLNCPIQVPPTIDEQKAIGEILTDLQNEIDVLESKLEKYIQLKQGLMQNLLTGKIRLV